MKVTKVYDQALKTIKIIDGFAFDILEEFGI